jgi:hypothetical protein
VTLNQIVLIMVGNLTSPKKTTLTLKSQI